MDGLNDETRARLGDPIERHTRPFVNVRVTFSRLFPLGGTVVFWSDDPEGLRHYLVPDAMITRREDGMYVLCNQLSLQAHLNSKLDHNKSLSASGQGFKE